MTSAVHKRKETLARKKYTNKFGEEIGTPGPESHVGSPSVEQPPRSGSPGVGVRRRSANAAYMADANMMGGTQQLRHSPFLNYDGAGGGVGLSQPHPPQHLAPYHLSQPQYLPHDQHPDFRGMQRMPEPRMPEQRMPEQNPFLDHGYADRGPRLPTFNGGPPNGGMGGYGGGEVKREERGGYGWPGGPPQ